MNEASEIDAKIIHGVGSEINTGRMNERKIDKKATDIA